MAEPKICDVFDAAVCAQRIRHLRVNVLNMRIDDFAEKAGIAGPTIRHYEHARCTPGAYAVFNICKAHGVSADWLLGLKEDGKDEA